jgi:hypothetical protein
MQDRKCNNFCCPNSTVNFCDRNFLWLFQDLDISIVISVENYFYRLENSVEFEVNVGNRWNDSDTRQQCIVSPIFPIFHKNHFKNWNEWFFWYFDKTSSLVTLLIHFPRILVKKQNLQVSAGKIFIDCWNPANSNKMIA